MKERISCLVIGLVLIGCAVSLANMAWGLLLVACFTAAVCWCLGGYLHHLRRLASRDMLTGLLNRRSFESAFRRKWAFAARTGRSISLLFLDLDDFGLINKRYGHLAGDEALRTVSHHMRQQLRKGDLLARWGGEEFVLLLPDTDLLQAGLVAERIRQLVAQCPALDRERLIPLTVSTGVAAYPGNASSPMGLLREAINGQMAAKVQKNAVEIVS